MKYDPLTWELKQCCQGYTVEQYNIIIDILGGCLKDLECLMLKMLGRRRNKVLANMQKAVISNGLNIARTLKIVI